MASAKIAQKALTAIAEEFAKAAGKTDPADLENIVSVLRSAPKLTRATNLASALPAGRFSGSAGKLAVPTPVAREMSEFIAGLAQNPRTLAKKDFPRVARALGLQPVEGFTYGRGGTFRNPSKKALQAMQANVEATATGDPNFYWDANRLILGSVPGVDQATAALTFAPFSAGTAVPENVRRWQRFIENPALFPGRMPGEGGRTAGNAWADALRILGKETPTAADLSTGGKVVKVGSFGENILDPAASQRATIDRHAVKNLLGIYLPDEITIAGKKLSAVPDLGDPATYAAFERPIVDAAKATGRLPHEVQSASWDTWRRLLQANPDTALLDPAAFVQLNQSSVLGLPANDRKEVMLSALSKIYGKDEKWLKRAGLV
jgi:hypothetical protein